MANKNKRSLEDVVSIHTTGGAGYIPSVENINDILENVSGDIMEGIRKFVYPKAKVIDKNKGKGYNGGTAQRTYLLPRHIQKDIFLRDGYIEGREGDYGLVKKAVGNRNIPVFQTAKDAITRDNLVPFSSGYRGRSNFENKFIDENKELVHAGSYPYALYIDGTNGNIYYKAWDLNDYTEDSSRLGQKGSLERKFKSIGTKVLDVVGSPTVVTTGFQPVTNLGAFFGYKPNANLQDLFQDYNKDLDIKDYPSNIGAELDYFMEGKGLHREKINNKYVYTLPEIIVTGNKKSTGGSNNIGSYKRSLEDAGRISDEEYYNIIEEEVANQQRNQKKNGGVNYKVKKGDSLSKIAQQYTGNALRYNELAKLNGIENPDKIEVGQNIVIPKQFLDTIKDTNLREVVVTGDKNKLKNKLENRNKLQNELDSKLKALTKRHTETPSTLRVQRIHNRSRSLEELNKPNFIERKIQDVKDVINESRNISDFFQTAWNGVAKNFVEDKKVTTKKRDIKINNNISNNKIKDNTVLDENFAKEIRNGTDTLTWDRVPMDKTGNKYYIQESYPITKNMRFGARNRGDYTPLNSNNAPLTTYRPLVKYENNKTGAVDGEGHENHFYGFDKEGKFKVGPLSEFGPGDTMTQAFYFDVVKVKRDKSGNIVYKEDRNNPGRFQPVVEGYDENTYDKNGKLQRGKYKESTITTMSKKRSLDGSYGNVSGGRVLLKADNETRIVSGSIDHVIQELELMQKNHKGKPVRYYQLDNGSYNRGLRTRNGKNISEQDLRDYDKQNTTAAGGGHFMYIRN